MKPAFVLSALVSGLLIGGMLITTSVGVPPTTAAVGVADR